ncbi:hypothetical protein HBI42_162240 [Parastagonospora nodorum]|nr:hypothetical protein HBI43_237350 [Parastagonospora nodorum]KAH6250008.1 hypothetical protein HBI42_162240 [Parastagonospora nodorum]
MHTSLTKELGARHSLLNLSVHNLVEKFARYSIYAVFKCLASSSNLSITIRYHISSLIYIKQAHLYADKYSKKHLKVCEADALKQVDTNVREEENKNYSSLYYFNISKEEELAKIKKEKREKENTFTLRTRQKCEIPKQKIAIDPANSILCNLSNLLVIRFCIFSNSALENIGILINKEVVEIQTNTTTALANKLTFTLKILEHVETFTLVCSFEKVDRHMFRANNTISIIRQTIFNEFYNCKLEGIIIAKFYKNL